MLFFHSVLEIKYRFLYLLLSIIITFITIYIYKYEMLYFVIYETSLFPSFIYTNLTEVFSSISFFAFFWSFYYNFPFLIAHIFTFILPGLYKNEAKKLYTCILYFLILFLIGSFFFMKVIFPWSWFFFTSFEQNYFTNFLPIYFENSLTKYIQFWCQSFFIFFLIIQVVFFLILLLTFGWITSDILKKKRKLSFFVFLFFSTCISPDVFYQLLLTSLLVFLYELSFSFVYLKKNYLNFFLSTKQSN